MKYIIVIAMSAVVLLLIATSSEAGWLIYHEPEFNGKILDIEAKQPIEGAVVVVVYRKSTIGLGAGTVSTIINVRETLTDKEGNFAIPSYTTFIQPFSKQIPTSFIIYKPGYASLELVTSHFTGKGINEEEGSWPWSKELKYRLHGLGIVELPKLKTREERSKNGPSPVGEMSDWKKQEKLIEAIRNEWKYLHNQDPKGLYQIKGE